MTVVADPNWFTIVGLFYTFFGIGQIARAASLRFSTVGEAVGEGRFAMASVTASFAMTMLAVGFSQLLMAQFAVMPFGTYAVLMLLGMAMMGLVFALVGEMWAARIASPSTVASSFGRARANGLSKVPVVITSRDIASRTEVTHAVH